MSDTDDTLLARPLPDPAIDQATNRGEDAPTAALADDATLDLDQAATYAGRAPATLRRVVRQGKLPRQYRPGLYGPELIFTRNDIDAWLSDMARAVEAMPPVPAPPATDDDTPATALAVEGSGATRLYALVALAYAQRLAAVEERLAAVEEQARAASDGWQLQAGALAGVRARLADLEARQQQAQQEPRNTQERRGAGPDRRSPDAVWIAEERRRADRRAQQDRERFEETVMGQYVPPPPAAIPHAGGEVKEERPDAGKEEGTPAAVEERRTREGHRRHPSLLARIFGRKG